MTNTNARSERARLLAMFGSLALLAGCAAPGEGEPTGTVAAALSSVGSDGATYTFEPGTFLNIATATTGISYPLDGPDTIFQTSLPVGTYTLQLLSSDGTLTLIRTQGAISEPFEATWTDPQPVTVQILDGQTTFVVLHLQVQGLGDVTFQLGSVAVTAEVVREDVPQFQSAREAGSIQFQEELYADPSAPYAAALDVDTVLEDPGASYSHGLVVHATGGWYQLFAFYICTDVVFEAIEPAAPGIEMRMAQLEGGAGRLCIDDYGATDNISIFLSSYGPAPASQQSFLPGASYTFTLSVQGLVGDVFDGTNLDQSGLSSPTAFTGGSDFYHSIYDSSGEIARARGPITGTIELSP